MTVKYHKINIKISYLLSCGSPYTTKYIYFYYCKGLGALPPPPGRVSVSVPPSAGPVPYTSHKIIKI